MKFSEDGSGANYRIDAYSADCVVVNGRDYHAGLIVSPERVVEGWGPAEPAGLVAQHIVALLELDPQVIIIGTGTRQAFPRPALYVPAHRRGIGIEIMDTGAACRTYNILVGEGRRVAAGLMLC